jgi:hypothetical protein
MTRHVPNSGNMFHSVESSPREHLSPAGSAPDASVPILASENFRRWCTHTCALQVRSRCHGGWASTRPRGRHRAVVRMASVYSLQHPSRMRNARALNVMVNSVWNRSGRNSSSCDIHADRVLSELSPRLITRSFLSGRIMIAGVTVFKRLHRDLFLDLTQVPWNLCPGTAGAREYQIFMGSS